MKRFESRNSGLVCLFLGQPRGAALCSASQLAPFCDLRVPDAYTGGAARLQEKGISFSGAHCIQNGYAFLSKSLNLFLHTAWLGLPGLAPNPTMEAIESYGIIILFFERVGLDSEAVVSKRRQITALQVYLIVS